MLLGTPGRPVRCGIPYGGTARYIIAHICRQANLTGKRKVDLGRTQRALFRALGIEETGGETGRIRYVQDQLWRIATASIRFKEMIPTKTGGRLGPFENAAIARRAAFWFEPDAEAKAEKLEYFGVELDEWFFQEITKRGIPVDMRALRELIRSPLAMDLYVWLTFRADKLWQGPPGTEVAVSWKKLHRQFGAGHKHTKDFTKRSKEQLENIRDLWPALDYETPRGRLAGLRRCTPHVRRKK